MRAALSTSRSSQIVQTERCGAGDKIVRIVMASPPVNSLGLDLITNLTAAFKQAGGDQRCEGIVLASNARAFCAGLNLRELHNASPEYLDSFWDHFQGDDEIVTSYSLSSIHEVCFFQNYVSLFTVHIKWWLQK